MAKKLAVLLLSSLIFPTYLFAQTCDTARADMNCTGGISTADMVLLMHVFYNGEIGCGTTDPNRGDLNCDGFKDATDITAIINCIFGGPFSDSCPPSNVRSLIPDSQDSIIIESKLVLSGGPASPYTTLKVWITNKDTLAGYALPLLESATVGNGFAILPPPPRTAQRMCNFLTTSFTFTDFSFLSTNDVSPDSFIVGQFYHPTTDSSYGLPNYSRKPLLEIKFESVISTDCDAQIEFDSIIMPPANTVQFVDIHTRRVPVNFVKGMITVNPRGDFDADGQLAPSDAVSLLNCVFVGTGNCSPPCRSDVNCDGGASPADAVLQLRAVFLAEPICIP